MCFLIASKSSSALSAAHHQHHPMEGANNSKRKRTRLTLSEQAEAARMLRSGTNAATVMCRFQVSRRTVTSIKTRCEEILKQADLSSATLNTKTLRSTTFPEIDEEVLNFVVLSRSMRFPITQAVIARRALIVREKLLNRVDISDEQRKKLESFSASKGWIIRFVHRHSLRSVALHGEAGSVTPGSVIPGMIQLRQDLSDYDVECIFNVDETGLFFKLLPRRTYVLELENFKSVRGTKAMKAKDRITAYVCTNAIGTKLPMAVIGKAKNPRCFRMNKPPVPYFSQKNAWSDTITFRRWFMDVFIPFVRRFTSKKVALVMDNCGPHGSDLNDPREQIQIFTLPPNCTSVHQPMDMGIIAAWKKLYRYEMLHQILKDVETRQKRREDSIAMPPGMRGLSEGFDPHMLDVTNLVKETWDLVSKETVVRCWLKSRCLPECLQGELSSHYSNVGISTSPHDVEKIVQCMEKLSLEVHRSDPLYDQTREQVTSEDVRKWLTIESDEDVRLGMVDDELQQQEIPIHLDNNEEADSAEEGDESPPQPLPSLPKILDTFRKLEIMAFNCDVEGAVPFLRRAKTAFLDKKRQEGGAERQLLITELLSSK